MNKIIEEKARELMETAEFDTALIFGNMLLGFARVTIPGTKNDTFIVQTPLCLGDGKEHVVTEDDIKKVACSCTHGLFDNLCKFLGEQSIDDYSRIFGKNDPNEE